MDQIIFVTAGTIVTVVYYILSPVKLSDRLLCILERFGRNKSDGVAGKAEKVRSYYVRNFK